MSLYNYAFRDESVFSWHISIFHCHIITFLMLYVRI